MRKLLFIALLATAATPALADDGHGWGRRERPARAETAPQQRPAQAPERAYVRAPEARAMPQQQMGGYAQQAPRGNWNRGGVDAGARANVQVDPSQMARFRERQAFRNSQVSADGAPQPYVRQQYRGQQFGGRQQYVGQQQYGGQQQYVGQTGAQATTRWGDHTRTYSGGVRPAYGGGYVQGTRTDGQRWDGNRSGSYSGDRYRSGQQWSNNWRQDRRYDWRSYRNQNRSIFRVGNFYDPFGYGYQPLSIGFTLFSGYYQPNYWLDDPYEYRLPPVYGPYRWVRYYNDAVLVDIYTGEVEDVIRDFFW